MTPLQTAINQQLAVNRLPVFLCDAKKGLRTMTRRFEYNDDDDFEIVDGQRILKDGRKLHVPLTMRDALPPTRARVTDGNGERTVVSFSRPGFRLLDDAAARAEREWAYSAWLNDLQTAYRDKKKKTVRRDPQGRLEGTWETEEEDDDEREHASDAGTDPREAALRDAINEQANSWRNPPTGEGTRGPRPQAEGDVCMIDGRAGHLQKRDGKLECIPDYDPAHPPRGDSRSVTEISREHQQRMTALLDAIAREQAEAWRHGK